MNWLPGIVIAVALSSYVQPTEGLAHKNDIYKKQDIVTSLCDKIIYHFKECGLLKGQQEAEAKEGLNDVILYTQNKKVNKRKHALASKLAEIICDSIEANNFEIVLKSAVQAISSAFTNINCKPDKVFIVAIKDMATEMYNADIKEAIIEAEENIIAARKKASAAAAAAAAASAATLSANKITSTKVSGISNTATTSAAAASSAAAAAAASSAASSSSQTTTTTRVSSAASAAASSSASAASSVNYLSIQSAVATSMASSSVMVGFRDRFLSSSDLIAAIIRCLCKFGVSQSLAQSIAYRYCSSITASSSAQVISQCIGTCVYQALSQSNVVHVGQEVAVSRRICSYILNYLKRCILKHRPAPYPYPYPGSIQSAAASSAAAAAAASSAASSSSQTTTTTRVSSAASAAASSSASAASEMSAATSFASSHLMSAIAKQRISNVKAVFASNGISSASVSTALSQALNLIKHDSTMAKSEILVEALLETLVAICQVISPMSMASGSSVSESIIKAIG